MHSTLLVGASDTDTVIPNIDAVSHTLLVSRSSNRTALVFRTLEEIEAALLYCCMRSTGKISETFEKFLSRHTQYSVVDIDSIRESDNAVGFFLTIREMKNAYHTLQRKRKYELHWSCFSQISVHQANDLIISEENGFFTLSLLNYNYNLWEELVDTLKRPEIVRSIDFTVFVTDKEGYCRFPILTLLPNPEHLLPYDAKNSLEESGKWTHHTVCDAVDIAITIDLDCEPDHIKLPWDGFDVIWRGGRFYLSISLGHRADTEEVAINKQKLVALTSAANYIDKKLFSM